MHSNRTVLICAVLVVLLGRADSRPPSRTSSRSGAISLTRSACIAAQLHGRQDSPFYVLASSGALVDSLQTELDAWRAEDTPVDLEPWLDALDEYLDNRDDPSRSRAGRTCGHCRPSEMTTNQLKARTHDHRPALLAA